MREQFIINARGSLRRRHRWLSDVLTAGLWIGWIFLWLPVFRKLREVVRLHVDFELAAREVLDTVTPISITRSLVALIGTAALLLLWSMLPKRKATHAHATLTPSITRAISPSPRPNSKPAGTAASAWSGMTRPARSPASASWTDAARRPARGVAPDHLGA